MRVLHVITGLGTGGAETMLCKLSEAFGDIGISGMAVALMEPGRLTPRLEASGVEVHHLGLERGLGSFQDVRRAMAAIRRFEPEVIQGWMYHGNLAASLLGAAYRGRLPVLWNVRASSRSFLHERPRTRALVKAGALLGRSPRGIIYNSVSGAYEHERLGYPAAKRLIIANGFPIPSQGLTEARRRARGELGIDEADLVIGMVGRFHPMKDHHTFLKAAASLLRRGYKARFALIGLGLEAGNARLSGWLDELGLRDHVSMLGERADAHALMPAFDIAALSSCDGEGFPNVIGEAMCWGIPCAATDVGDSAFIIGDTGKVVPPGKPDALAVAWRELIDFGPAGRLEWGLRARARMREFFSLEAIAREYSQLYGALARPAAGDGKESRRICQKATY